MEFLSHFPHPVGVLLLRSENSKRLMQVIAPRRGAMSIKVSNLG